MKERIFGWREMKDHRSVRTIIYIVLGFVMYLAMVDNVMPEKLDIRPFSIAPEDILSPVTTVDGEATKEKQNEAAAAVAPKYTFKQTTALVQIEKANAIYDTAIKIAQQKKAITSSTDANGGQADTTNETEKVSTEEKISLLKSNLSQNIVEELPKTTLKSLVTTQPSDLTIAKEITGTTLNAVMAKQIKWGELAKAKRSVNEVFPESSLPPSLKKAAEAITKQLIVPNYVLNAKKTKQARQEAIESVDPVLIQEGQILAKKGQVINHQMYHQIEVAGLLDDSFNPYPYLGLGILVFLLMAFVSYETSGLESKVRSGNTYVLMYGLVMFVTFLLMKITSLLSEFHVHGLIFLVPAAVGTMLIRLLISERLAITTSFVLAVCASILFNESTLAIMNFTFGIYVLFSCLAGAVLIGKRNARPRILKTGLMVSLVNILVVLIFLFLKTSQLAVFDVVLSLGFAFLAGFLSSVLTLGFMPFFEVAFGILSTMRLIELSNPNHPLLRKILTEAPGTYHHSVMVANLAEAACEAIGANGLLARVAAYYHDIGKTKRPRFFIENQMGMENPHDKISPQLSRTVILSHPYDGAIMLREHRLPKEIVDIAEQHHGTTLLSFFYNKALQSGAADVSESEFRYPGPKVQTKEAAVIEIADSVEAATRSLSKPKPEKIESLVRKIITARLEDGQFDECQLTLKELDTVAQSICETLKGIFHSRIEYPEVDWKKKVGHA
ncbi:MAG TPA: HD family phosphohydrolase [Bacillales bacterium]|nr:HD family phosphohydrolase [Bacillales bacterium]